jgi:DNA polymerase-3 subunit alpha (Gram-positive type)
MGITDVNPLPPHQFCPKCGCSVIWPGVASGFDYHDDHCVFCKIPRMLDGHDIPVEMFLGDESRCQTPVIEISVPNRIRKEIFSALEEAFGKGNVLHASVIHTMSHTNKDIFEKVREYCAKYNINLSDMDIKRIAERLSWIRGGSMGSFAGIYIIPQNADVECGIPTINSGGQLLAAFPEPYLSQHLPSLKIPSLCIADMFKTLYSTTGIRYDDVQIKKEALSLFSSAEKLGIPTVTLSNGTAGIPEFSSAYVQSIIRVVRPKTFSDYVKVCALSHGSGVWQDNQETLFYQGAIGLNEAIAIREDVYQLLMDMNYNDKRAYSIMELVRKGKLNRCSKHDAIINELYHAGLSETQVNVLMKIRYLLPKAHAVSNTIKAAKMAWYKLHYPSEFYEAYFESNLLSDDLINDITLGPEYIQNRIEEINKKNCRLDYIQEQQKKETYQVAYEMLLRGYSINEAGKVIPSP